MATLAFIFFLVYVLPCILVALLAKANYQGFWGAFFLVCFLRLFSDCLVSGTTNSHPKAVCLDCDKP